MIWVPQVVCISGNFYSSLCTLSFLNSDVFSAKLMGFKFVIDLFSKSLVDFMGTVDMFLQFAIYLLILFMVIFQFLLFSHI